MLEVVLVYVGVQALLNDCHAVPALRAAFGKGITPFKAESESVEELWLT